MGAPQRPWNDEVSSPRRSRPVRTPGRSLAAGILGVVAILSLFLSTAAVWVHTVLFDADRVATSVGDSLSRPEVSKGVADFLTGQIFELAQVERRSSDAVPDRLEPLLPGVQALAERQVSERVEQLVTSDRGRAVIVEAARQSHKTIVAALEDKPLPNGIAVGEDAVSLNLLPLLFQGLDAAAQSGLVSPASLPALTAEGSVTDQIRQLELAFQVDLPDTFGQFEIYQGDKVTKGHDLLGVARQTLKYFNQATVMVVLLTLVSAAGTVGLARRRFRAVALLAAGSALVLLLQRVLVDRAVEESSNLLIDPTARSMVSSVVNTLTSSLLTGTTVIVWVSVAAAVVATGVGAFTRRRATA